MAAVAGSVAEEILGVPDAAAVNSECLDAPMVNRWRHIALHLADGRNSSPSASSERAPGPSRPVMQTMTIDARHLPALRAIATGAAATGRAFPYARFGIADDGSPVLARTASQADASHAEP